MIQRFCPVWMSFILGLGNLRSFFLPISCLNLAIKILLSYFNCIFVGVQFSSYLTKTASCNKLNAEIDMIIQISSVKPDVKRFSKTYRCHSSCKVIFVLENRGFFPPKYDIFLLVFKCAKMYVFFLF